MENYQISALFFADDVVLLAPSSCDLQPALGRLAFQVGGEVLPQEGECDYVGVLFTTGGTTECKMDRQALVQDCCCEAEPKGEDRHSPILT